ncbi:PucR family transcriptional regulator [Mycolicibacterium moriokaense]|uniref:DNA-binding PucR family transcriptional regulator n=1 Tax=Mycolicibacterium moriokaense TaxID=39691 RepID=A0A318HA14_9MYCO|nr:helix-turn-helix domain-containing protein [Mycolicibacterium moriokaense]PXX04269.1 DNA-binding PucR family transcriptional regulator [Mycolicibacterium moriokaense]
MAKAGHADTAVVGRCAAEIVGRLDLRMAELTGAMHQMLVTEIAELRGDAQLLQLLRDSIDGNVATVFSAIRHGIPIEKVELPTAAVEHARRLAQRGTTVNALVRAYRLGHKALLDAVLVEIGLSDLDPQLSLAVFRQISEVTFGYIDWITQQVVSTYQDEHDRWMENRNSLRAMRVRELLDGADLDIDEVATSIRYPLRRTHIAIVAWRDEDDGGDDLASMERFVDQLADSAGARESSLHISVDRLTGWAWIPVQAEATPTAVTRIRACAEARPDAPWIAAGDPLPGVEGFRRSHEQAQEAHAVAIAAGSNAQRVTASSDHGLSAAALLNSNLGAARVWVAEVLGPLASCTENDERLRETLGVFLRAGGSFKAAAEELHLHTNSIKYRVQRAIDRRGRPISDGRLDVEIALLLCHWYGNAVLADA